MVTRAIAILLPIAAWAQIAEEMRKAELDPNECYRVREVNFARGDDLRYYLTDGFLIFGKPVGGRVVSAVFSADTEGGDAEILTLPPSKGERVSLAAFTGSPNLDEHFKSALFLFTDDSAEALRRSIEQAGEVKKNAERGLLLANEWNPVVSNLSGSFSIRLAQHLLSGIPKERGVFYSAIQGRTLGNFDAIYDPDVREQIFLGQLKFKENRAYYDTWTQFPARSFRTGSRTLANPDITASNFRIEGELDASLHLKVVTKTTVTAERNGTRVLPFEITEGMRVTAARVNGKPAELFTRDALRANLIRGNDSILFLVMSPVTLGAGEKCEVEFEHEGNVVRPAGRNVYYVGSRSNWYPRWGANFAMFDIRFRYPANLQMVFAGEVKEDRTVEGERITRRVTTAPIRLAGFNLGQYESVKTTRGSLSVEVFANKSAEFALRSRPSPDAVSPAPFPRPQRGPRTPTMNLPPPLPDPTARLRLLANEIAAGFEFFAGSLGPPAVANLLVSPIPGGFGQGFPGLVYLSTIAYLDPMDRPAAASDGRNQTFFSEILSAHETAHQWWGNVVWSGSIEDDWLMEALANYSALMVLERKKGAKALQQALEGYKENLLKKAGDERTIESAGPIRLGMRLSSSQSPDAWHYVVYGKGSWIIHMLRKRMGDAQFLKMLGEVCRKYRFRALSSRQFQEVAAAYLPKGYDEPFFEQWVESTGIPSLAMKYSYKPGRLTVTVTQSDVDENASIQVPVVVQAGAAKSQTVWVTTGSEPATVMVALREAPVKVTLDPESWVLRK